MKPIGGNALLADQALVSSLKRPAQRRTIAQFRAVRAAVSRYHRAPTCSNGSAVCAIDGQLAPTPAGSNQALNRLAWNRSPNH